ncbi:hypothetical protein evm_007947 [Chilo suppressalis]|nr:hypothetical protein evm_007947 [Chilo suppressalis]
MNLSSVILYIIGLLWLHLTDAKIGYFWHITDLHYDPFHNSPEFHRGCKHSRGTNEHSHRNGRHRDHTCDSSWALIQSAAAFMSERHPDTLEFVLWTGSTAGCFRNSTPSAHFAWGLASVLPSQLLQKAQQSPNVAAGFYYCFGLPIREVLCLATPLYSSRTWALVFSSSRQALHRWLSEIPILQRCLLK